MLLLVRIYPRLIKVEPMLQWILIWIVGTTLAVYTANQGKQNVHTVFDWLVRNRASIGVQPLFEHVVIHIDVLLA